MPLFQSVFKKYDNLNNSIQENVKGMRVVKSFVREDYEKNKFGKASEEVCADFTKAERLVALNSPAMQIAMYTAMIIVSYVGAKLIINSGASEMGVGALSSMFTYGMQILSSLDAFNDIRYDYYFKRVYTAYLRGLKRGKHR